MQLTTWGIKATWPWKRHRLIRGYAYDVRVEINVCGEMIYHVTPTTSYVLSMSIIILDI